MIDHKTQLTLNDNCLDSGMVASTTMTNSSSFTHLSLDTDEMSINIDEPSTANGNHPTQPPPAAATQSTPPSTHSFAMYDALIDICHNNIAYFECDDSESGQRFLLAFRGIIDHLTVARQYVQRIVAFVHEYDFDEHTPANGYRSFVSAVQACINHNVKVAKYIAQNRCYLLFRKNMYMKEIEACCHLLASLCSCLDQLMILRESSEYGSLFPVGDHKASGLFKTSASVNQYCFYGRCIGFHYCESMQSVIKFLGICMAGFSEAYYRDGNRLAKATSSMFTGGKYYWNPELRARRIVNLSQFAGIDFCKAFWSLTESELMYALPNVFGAKIKVNRLITIPPEPLEMESTASPNGMIKIPVPSSHLGVGSVTARLMSNVRREGMIGERNKKHIHSLSNALIFHCHGGGFVAQSSKSHEVYLREWAARIDAPILSIDYSLAPQAPYPRALEEVFYAYCWAIKNAKALGTTAEKIVVVGDSAGANLNMALTLKCIEQKIRKPDGVFLIYCPVKISFDPSPARYLCMMDVLLPFGFLMGCLKAYVHPGDDQFRTSVDKRKIDRIIEDDEERKNGEHENVSTASTTSAVIVVVSDSESEMPTFVHVDAESNDKNLTIDGRQSDASPSIGGSSDWEHIDSDAKQLDENDDNDKSLISDGTSDTFASASFQNSQSGGNTDEMMTPDESNGISFEEDSQPITLHNPANSNLNEMPIEPVNGVEQINGNQSATSIVDELTKHNFSEPNDVEKTFSPRDRRKQSQERILNNDRRDSLNIPHKIYRAVETAANSVANTLNAITLPTTIRNGISVNGFERGRLNSLSERNPADDYLFDIAKDPFVSPYFASDEMLRQLPPVKILSVEMDPCLDDCIMMAKKLKALGLSVGLDVLPGLPHGFLSFVKLSKEAYEGNRVCISRLAELLGTTTDAKC